MSRSFLLDARYQQFLHEQYEKETKARLKFYEQIKEGREHTPKSYIIGLPCIDPMQFALKKKREEDAMKAEILEKARSDQGFLVLIIDDMQLALMEFYEGIARKTDTLQKARSNKVSDVMWPVPARVRCQIYQGLSHDNEGRKHYLRNRVNDLIPEERFTLPMLSSWQYGWKVRNDPTLYEKSKYPRVSKIEETFYRKNGVPILRDPVSGNGACVSDVLD